MAKLLDKLAGGGQAGGDGASKPDDKTSGSAANDLASKVAQELKPLVGQAHQMGQLLADPDIQKLIKLKAAGKMVDVRDADVKPVKAPTADLEPVELDLDDPKQFAKHMMERMDTMVSKRLDEALKPMNDQLNGVRGFMSHTIQNNVQKEIEAAKAKFSDFEQFEGDAAAVLKDNPGLSAEECYLLAKLRKGQPITTDVHKHSERPSTVASRPAVKVEGPSHSRSAFFEAIAQSLGNQSFEGVDK